jgi:hypothetical protein
VDSLVTALDMLRPIKSDQECLTKRWSRLAIASCGMARLLAASCSTFSLGHEDQSQSQSRVGATPLGSWCRSYAVCAFNEERCRRPIATSMCAAGNRAKWGPAPGRRNCPALRHDERETGGTSIGGAVPGWCARSKDVIMAVVRNGWRPCVSRQRRIDDGLAMKCRGRSPSP